MSRKAEGKRRVFGVRQEREDNPPRRFVRPEGTALPLVSTNTHHQDGSVQQTMAPKRWEERQAEKTHEGWKP